MRKTKINILEKALKQSMPDIDLIGKEKFINFTDFGFINQYNHYQKVYKNYSIIIYHDGYTWMLRILENYLKFTNSKELKEILRIVQIAIKTEKYTLLSDYERKLNNNH